MNRSDLLAAGLTALLATLPATSALADEFSILSQTPANRWTGFYVGGLGGGAFTSAKISQTMTTPSPFAAIDTAAVSASASPTLQPGTALAGIEFGYNQQWNHFVLGGEVDMDYFGGQTTRSTTSAFPSTPTSSYSVTSSISTSWLLTARERLGWATDHWLIYAGGGLAVERENFYQSVALIAPSVQTTSASSTRLGWAAGVGAEYAITRNWSIKGEYLHVDLGSMNTVATLTPPYAGLVLSGNEHLTSEIARGGVSYHF